MTGICRLNAESPAPPPGATLHLFAQTDAGDMEAEVCDCALTCAQGGGSLPLELRSHKFLNALPTSSSHGDANTVCVVGGRHS